MGFVEKDFRQGDQVFGNIALLSPGLRHRLPYKNKSRDSLYITPEPMRQRTMGSYPNGAPPCKIYHPGRSVTQSAPLKDHRWVLEFEMTGHRWKDAFTGHDASDDPFEQIHLVFPDRQSAVYYARRQGLECRVFPDIEAK